MVKVCHYFSCICDCIVRFRTIVFIYLFVGTYPLIRAAVSAFVGSAQMSTASTEPVSLFTTLMSTSKVPVTVTTTKMITAATTTGPSQSKCFRGDGFCNY